MPRLSFIGSRAVRYFLFLLLCCGTTHVVHAQQSFPAPLSESLIQAGISPQSVSIWVAPIANGKPIIDFQSRLPRTPASVAKIITTGTGLILLGADFRWKTDFYLDGKLTNGTLNGNLIIKGYGNPYLVQENMADYVAALNVSGLRHINGDVILDNSYFVNGIEQPNAFDGQGQEPYNAIPHALTINFRTITLLITVKQGQAVISTQPTLAYTRIQNNLIVNQNKRCRGRGFAPRIDVDANQDLITLSGTISKNCRQKRLSKVLTDAGDLYFGHFNQAFKATGGTLSGTWHYGKVPKNAKLFYQARSQSLSKQIKAMNKLSNNIMTRQLFLTIGAERTQPPATLDKSRAVILHQLKRMNVPTQSLFIDNGSGLSRISQVSAQQLGKFLIAMQKNDYAKTHFEQSLAVAGVDGTLRYRLKNTPLAGNAVGKTGTLKNAKSLAGYLTAQSGTKYAYALLVEGERAKAARPFMDELLQWVYFNH